MRNNRISVILITTAIFMLVALIAMQFTDEVNWTLIDFTVASALLICTGLICDLVLQKIKNNNYRVALLAAVFIAFILIWAELAVGIFGTPFAGH